ncbi:MAG: alcohol dehydrogenase catalytic domain-containing protein, partial [Flavisolibacter sp.]|nr:alcohol dehydrogenase catalytic domain-containing protein [Flavisolibacter sp.]
MKAAILAKPKVINVEQVNIPQIKEDEVRIRVEGCGICSSSIPLWEGREWFQYPQEPGTPGHEGWGVVEETGDNIHSVKKGDRVAFLSYHAYAEYDVANENSLVKLPDALNSKAFPAEPLGCAINIFERSDIHKEDTVAIIG